MWNSEGIMGAMGEAGLHAGSGAGNPMGHTSPIKRPTWRDRWGPKLAGAIGDVGRLFGSQMEQRPMNVPPMQNYGIMDEYKPPMQNWQSPDILPRRY